MMKHETVTIKQEIKKIYVIHLMKYQIQFQNKSEEDLFNRALLKVITDPRAREIHTGATMTSVLMVYSPQRV